MNKRFEICPTEELPPGDRTIVDLNGFSVGVFNIDGEYFALKNDCPHQRAPLCEGKITGTTAAPRAGEYEWRKDGEILRCPWHGWEFEIETGESVFNPHKVRAKSFEATVESVDRAGSEGDGVTRSEPEESSRSEPEDDSGLESRVDGGSGPDDKPCSSQEECYGTTLQGDEPPVETYNVKVEEQMVVVYF